MSQGRCAKRELPLNRLITNLVDRLSPIRFIRYLTATPTLLLTALLTLVLLFYSLSLALGAERSKRTVGRECIAKGVHHPATWCADALTDGSSRASRPIPDRGLEGVLF